MTAVAETVNNSQDINDLNRVFEIQKAAFAQAPYPSAAERLANLKKLKVGILKYTDLLCASLNEDFGNRAEAESKLAEILTTLEGIKYYSKHLKQWMKSTKRKVGMAQAPGSARVMYQPLGVVGVISPWNYPVYLATGPMIAALAAGNRVMVKMSEATPKTAEVFKKMCAELYDEDLVAVVTGEAEVGMEFSKKPFDHIIFTGSTQVGHHIMRAAAENLTPVTLELGGKSPTIIHESYDITTAVERMSFGKCFNAGQTCVSPDYVFVHETKIEEFVQAFEKQVTQMYPTMLNNPDLTSVVNDRQANRLRGYLQDAQDKGARIVTINPANENFEGTNKIPYTLVLDVTQDMKIAQDEIFGPLLIVRPFKQLQETIDFVNNGPRPLALYYFDNNKQRQEHMLTHTHSGGVCINDTMSHVGVDDLPFGGVGHSGMGHYHGYEGFLTFSKAKGIYTKGFFNAAKYALPPFSRGSVQFMLKNLIK